MTTDEAPPPRKRFFNAVPAPMPAPPAYPPQVSLTDRQLRTLVKAESSEALELARRAGVEIPS